MCCVGPGGAKEILVEDFAAQPAVRKTTVPFTSGNVFIYGFLNEYVLVNHLYSEQYDDAGNMELLYTQYAVNQNTGEITEITLSNYSMATQKAINIIAQFGDDLLVDAKEGSENDLAYRRALGPHICLFPSRLAPYLGRIFKCPLPHRIFPARLFQKASPPLGFRLVINVRSAPPHTLLPGQPAPSSHARHKNTCADASGSISSTPMKPPQPVRS